MERQGIMSDWSSIPELPESPADPCDMCRCNEVAGKSACGMNLCEACLADEDAFADELADMLD